MTQQLPLLLFSGGADSTYVLWGLLRTSPVDVLYVKAAQHPAKSEMELQRQAKIIEVLEKGALHGVRERIVKEVQIPLNREHYFQQVIPWMVGALAAFVPHRHSEVVMAYLMNDDIMINRSELLETWKYLTTLLYGEPVKLSLPLTHVRKRQIYEALDDGLQKLIWVCELPVEKGEGKRRRIVACGDCPACQTQALQYQMLKR